MVFGACGDIGILPDLDHVPMFLFQIEALAWTSRAAHVPFAVGLGLLCCGAHALLCGWLVVDGVRHPQSLF